jgi:hypothetical protein
LQSLTHALRLLKPGLDFLSLMPRGPRRTSRMTRKSTQLTGEITRIAKTVETASSSPQIRRRRRLSIALMTQISGARSIAPQDMIQKSAKLFWIARRCHHQQHRWPRSPNGASIIRLIPPMTMSRWERSMGSSEVACLSPQRHKGKSLSGRSVWLSASSLEE